MHTGFRRGNMKERCHPRDAGIDGRVIRIKIDLKEAGWEGVDWTDFAVGRDKWQTPVNTRINLRVSQNTWNFLTEDLVAFQE